jgi:putative transposase
MSRQSPPLVAQCHEGLLQRLRALKAAHPFWGYWCIWAYLRFIEQQAVNKKRTRRLIREHHLLVPPNGRLKAKRTPTQSKPKPTKPDEWWSIDMTKVLVEGCGWVDIVVVLDWYTKRLVGYEVGLQYTTPQWLVGPDRAVNRRFPKGGRGQGLSLMHDHGCQPTSMAFMKVRNIIGIYQVSTSDNNPKGTAETERVMRTLKEKCLWLHEWTSPVTLAHALKKWIDDYHEHYLHAALGYKPPRPFEREYHGSHGLSPRPLDKWGALHGSASR